MSKVFVSYRRDDSAGFAGRLTDALERRFGADSVFRDVDDIAAGADFGVVIEQALQQVQAVLVVIGPRWLDARDERGRRLDDPGDYVRREVELALASGKPVIPVLVGGATMPTAEALPPTLRGLANRNALALGDAGWGADLARLEVALAQWVGPTAPGERSAPVRGRRALAAAMVALLLVGDDMLQYWWHRASHSPLLWPLHRAHHSAQYMSARIIYRNNFFYYVGMPAIWMSGVLVYLGLGQVYLVYIVVKLAVITGAHSSVRWDEPLYKIKALAPLMWVVQRTISTPTTHFAHHAMTNADGIGNYKGNFGNLLFFWDVLFGSAHITQRFPAQVGLRDDRLFGAEKWWVELFYPVFRSKRAHSALVPGGKPYDEGAETAPTSSNVTQSH